MGNCKGKQSKLDKSLAREEMYKPSQKGPDETVQSSNTEIDNKLDANQKTEVPILSADSQENKDVIIAETEVNDCKVKAKAKIDQITVKTSEDGKDDCKVKAKEDIDPMKVQASEDGVIDVDLVQTSDIHVDDNKVDSDIRDNCKVKVSGIACDDRKINNPDEEEVSKVKVTVEEIIDVSEEGLPEKDTVANSDMKDSNNGKVINTDPKVSDFEKSLEIKDVKETEKEKAFLFSKGRDDEMPESEFIDKKTGRPDTNITETGNHDNAQQIPNSDEMGNIDELPRTDNQKFIATPSDCVGAEGGTDTGYNSSRFAIPVDKETQNNDKPTKEPIKINIGKKKEKKKKKKKDKSDLPSNVQHIEYVGILNIGNDKVVIDGHGHKDKIKPGEIEQTSVIKVEVMEILTKVSKSVGYIHGLYGTGTCFRVGKDKIMTAAHVIVNNIRSSIHGTFDMQELSKIGIDFDYIEERGSQQSSSMFKLEPSISYLNEGLDVAILQLRKDGRQLPPPLTHIYSLDPERDHDKQIYLISHNMGKEKEINMGIGLWTPTESRMNELEKFCNEYGIEYGYSGLDRPDSLVINCDFIGGASGSPGIIIRGKIPHVVMVYQKGYPYSYYSQRFPKEKKRTFPRDKLFQQGKNIESVYKDLSTPQYIQLRDEIFPHEAQTSQRLMQHQYAMAGDNRQELPYYGKEHVLHNSTTTDINLSVQSTTRHEMGGSTHVDGIGQTAEKTSDEWVQIDKDDSQLEMLKDFDLFLIGNALNPGKINTLGLSFGYQNVDIERIKENNQRDLCYHLLLKWRNNTGRAATLKKLLLILKEAHHLDSDCVNVQRLKTEISKLKH